MSANLGNQRVFSHRFNVNATAAEAFPLLCPTREYDWIETWSCRLVYSNSGFAEANCVFETDLPHDEKEIWIVSRYEPPRAIEFVKMAAGRYVVKYDVSLSPNDDGTASSLWTQTLIGLSEAGNQYIDEFDSAAFHEKMDMLGKMLNYYLSTGKKLEIIA